VKVCIMGKSISTVSGHSRPAFDLAQELATKGHNVVILRGGLPSTVPDTIERQQDGGDFEIVTIPSSLIAALCFRRRRTLNTIKNLLKDTDVLHLFDYVPPGLIRACTETSFPIIYTLNGPYRERMSELFQAGLPSFINIMKPSFFSTILTPGFIFKKLLDSFDNIISTSQYMVEDIVSLGIARKKVSIVPLWMNTQSFATSIHGSESRFTFVFLGWGSSIRGVPDIIKAFGLVLRSIPKARLVLCFSGFHGLEEKMYKYLIRRNDMQGRIILKGYQPDIFRTLHSATAVVLPFRSACGYAQPPLVVLEAMALGKCVISTSVGSIPEVISHGETGLLVEPRDYQSLAQRMIEACDWKLRRKIGYQARQYVIEKHDVANIIDNIIEVYNTVSEGFYGKIRC